MELKKQEHKSFKRLAKAILACCGLLMGMWTTQSCENDFVLTGQPEWLGDSIYEQLQDDGHFTTLLKLIDDLDQKEVLSHTGSKTLFAANDEAFAQWFSHNNWGVRDYSKLTTAQKKMLLNNSMINNAYLIELLSNVSGNPPMEGMCMRRETASSIYDSVYIMKPTDMPNTAAWAKFKESGKSIPIFKDATSAPMIHFLPAFMSYYNMTNEDLSILTNHQATSTAESWVNGVRVGEKDITCKNGYIQKVDGVIESSPNMAEIIRQHPNMSMWSSLIDRFSAPYYNDAGTKEYNRLYNNQDSVYTMRYYSKRSAGGNPNAVDPSGEAVTAQLSFDPGWNQYMYANTMDYDLHYDAGAMIVPTNEALTYWWNNEGRDLQTEYGSWDSIPDATLAKLLNVNMLPTFTNALPSKFDNVLNDAKEALGIKVEHVDSCFMGCNGVVYLVNRVFSPAEYASVAYPALAHASTMNVIYWAIDQLNFLPYLLSMDSRYSLLLPTNDAMLWYLDPAFYGKVENSTGLEAPSLLEFYYDPTKREAERVQARRYTCTVDENGVITVGPRTQAVVSNDVIKDRLSRLMDQLIIVGDVEDGHEYYKSKGGTLLRVTKTSDGRLAFSGGWDIEHNNVQLPVNKDEIYTKTNGKSYQLNDRMPLSAQNSFYMTLKNHEEYSKFLDLIDHDGSELMITKLNAYNAGLTDQGSKNFKLFDNYNYTVYVPTNQAIQELIDQGVLPTWDDYEAQTEQIWGSEELADSAQKVIKNIIVDFIRYHVQDHSVAINMAPENGTYNNVYESMLRNPETGRFYPLKSNASSNSLTITDEVGNTRHVIKTEGLYNQICRDYWFRGAVGSNTAVIFMASDAVVHQIDGCLMYKKQTPWKQQLKKIRRK
ncbi:MAG: fasciclin domain-containing protein [Prevotella sp.]|nr:fasciclin domain-containing protein [Prevotella sp.]